MVLNLLERWGSAISMFIFNYVLMKYVGAEGVAAFTFRICSLWLQYDLYWIWAGNQSPCQ